MNRSQPLSQPFRTRTPGRGWAYTGVILGGAVSIAANITHTFVPPEHHPAGWTPAPMAVIFATSWPVFLFVAIEILARTPWPRLWNWTLLRWLGVTPVALVAAFVSYRHLSGLLAHYGEEPLAAFAGPLAVDGLMVVATGALLATSRHRDPDINPNHDHDHDHDHNDTPQQPYPVSVPATVPAVTASTSMAPTPSVSLMDTTSTKPAQPTEPATTPQSAKPAGPVTPAAPAVPEVPTPAELAARITAPRTADPSTAPAAVAGRSARTRTTRPNSPNTPAPGLAPSTTDTHVTASDAAQLTLPVVPSDLLARAGQVARQYRTEHGTPITPGQLAVRLKVTSEEASQALAVLDLDPSPNNPTAPVPTVNGNRPNGTRNTSPKATR